MESAAIQDGVERVVHLAQEHLGMDLVLVAEFTGGRQVVRAAAGDLSAFAVSPGVSTCLEDTFCAMMVDGLIPNVIPDTGQEMQLRDLATSAAIGAYIGVPLYLPDGELYGSFCSLSRKPASDLTGRDGKFMAMLGELLGEQLAADRELRERRALIEQVLRTSDLAIALQPVVDLVTGRCLSMEALARFRSPLESPAAVFAQAEQVGLRLELETMAASQAMSLLPSLVAPQCLAVNLSPDVGMHLLPRAAELPLDRIILEMTEHAAVTDYARVRALVQPLRDRGLRLAVDDAGAGYSSLRHIVELRPDIIKIDQALVAGIDQDPARRSALTTFVLLALDIGALIVAEGVETLAELRTLADLGVDAVQGYLLARPSTDAADIARWARAKTLLPKGF